MLAYFGKSDIGKKRSTNQDAYRAQELPDASLLVTVCDGMGGTVGGAEASGTAIHIFSSCIADFLGDIDKDGTPSVTGDEIVRQLRDAVIKANGAVYSKAISEPELAGMGTTLTSALIYGNTLYTVNVGDSRIYILRDGEEMVTQLTHDHSFVQMLVDMGHMTKDEAKNAPNRNIITRAVGIEDKIEADIYSENISAPFTLLLCSDGLSGPLEEEKISEILKKGLPPKETTELLIDTANAASGSDNITAAVIRRRSE